MAQKLTKRLIDAFTHEGKDGKKDIRWDEDMSGFGVRVYPSGKKSFVLFYRQNGTQRLYTIGQYGKITLQQAYDLAQKRLGEVADGKDPVLSRKASRKKHEWTVERAFKDFMAKYAKTHNKNWGEKQRIYDMDIADPLGKKPIDEVKKDDIIKILDTIMDRGSGTMANRTLAVIRKFFNWCIERGLIEYSPAYRISAPSKNRSRDRVLADYELKEIWEETATFGYPFGHLMQFLILTGQRRGETTVMRWEDYDADEKVWILPRETTKSGRQHEVPLSDQAIRILESIPRLGEYVFTSAGNRPFENHSRAKDDLDRKLKERREKENSPPMPSWRIHDLRRTAASGMARLKIAPHVIEKVQNRVTGNISGIAAVYNRYEYMPEKREALDAWADYVEKLVNSKEVRKSILRLKRT